jgi:hypothetical protein
MLAEPWTILDTNYLSLELLQNRKITFQANHAVGHVYVELTELLLSRVRTSIELNISLSSPSLSHLEDQQRDSPGSLKAQEKN